MSSENQNRGKKRSKAFYRKSNYSNKRQKVGANVLQPGIRGFLVMCNSNEKDAVRESYNILNEYGDLVFGPYKPAVPGDNSADEIACLANDESGEDEDDCEDIEKALKKEVASIKNIASTEKRFQNVATKAKNCVFIRTTVEDPVKLVTTAMENIAEKKLKRARYAARMLPIIGTCKAQTGAISELAKEALKPYFSRDVCENPPKSFTIIFKARNNNGTACGKESVISNIRNIARDMNQDLTFSWSDYEVAVLVEIVCNVCCLGLAPGFHRLRKYNFQELSQGPRVSVVAEVTKNPTEIEHNGGGQGKGVPDSNLEEERSHEESEGKCDLRLKGENEIVCDGEPPNQADINKGVGKNGNSVEVQIKVEKNKTEGDSEPVTQSGDRTEEKNIENSSENVSCENDVESVITDGTDNNTDTAVSPEANTAGGTNVAGEEMNTSAVESDSV